MAQALYVKSFTRITLSCEFVNDRRLFVSVVVDLALNQIFSVGPKLIESAVDDFRLLISIGTNRRRGNSYSLAGDDSWPLRESNASENRFLARMNYAHTCPCRAPSR